MVAGATGIDLFLLVIDAGEGARPQTHEHLAIIRLLGIEHGVVAVTKADAVDEETLELALEEARELVPEAEAIAVSAKTGAGLDELRAALGRAAELVFRNTSRRRAAARLYVDRVFSLRGIGTVATGTLWSGTVGEGDVLRAEPGGRDVRVRSVQVHDRAGRAGRGGAAGGARAPGRRAERAAPRRRAASLPAACGRATGSTSRSTSSSRSRTERACTSTTARPPSSARVVRVGDVRAAAARGAGRRRARRPGRAPRRDDRRRRHRPRPGARPARRPGPLRAGAPRRDPHPRAGARRRRVALLRRVAGRARSPAGARARRRRPARSGHAGAHRAVGEGRARAAPVRAARLDALPAGRDRRARRARCRRRARSLASLAAAEPGAAKAEDAELARFLERAGRLVRLGDGWAVTAAAYERARSLVRRGVRSGGQISLARFRDLAGCGRRDAQLLLERLDADGVTRRVGEARVLRRRASTPAS